MTEIIIDGNAVKSHEDIHTIFGTALHLPEWYGKNLDALYDCLTDMSDGITVTLKNLDELEAAMGARYPAFLRMLYDAAEENHRIKVIEAGGDKDEKEGD